MKNNEHKKKIPAYKYFYILLLAWRFLQKFKICLHYTQETLYFYYIIHQRHK